MTYLSDTLSPIADALQRKLPRSMWGRGLAVAWLVAWLGALGWFLVVKIREDPWVLLFYGGMALLIFLMLRFPAVERGFDAAYSAYLRFCVWMLVAIAPGGLALVAARLLAKLPGLLLQVVLLAAWAGLLIVAIRSIATERRRTRVFNALSEIGSVAPYVYAVNVFLIAQAFFGSLTLVLMENHAIAIGGAPGRVFDFYGWHLLDAIPVLKVNETLHWKAPLSSEDSLLGSLVLLFKLTVIVPVIASFRGYWEFTQAKESLTPTLTGISTKP